ncbi:MAG: hypothetical protein IT258_24345 [Saprospiraceae bacterium]|nr:hypothetical protein [Saprospiraceae bacterium]
MKNLLYLLAATVMLAGCASQSATVDEVKSAVEGHNFIFIDKKNEKVPVYLVNGCVVNMRWDYTMLFSRYEIKEEAGLVMLVCGAQAFVAGPPQAGGFEFVDVKNGEKIISAKENAPTFSLEQLSGDWTDTYAYMVRANPAKQPETPCPNLPKDSFMVPKIIVSAESFAMNDYCGQQTTRPFVYNAPLGVLIFDDPCLENEQWIIKELKEKEMVVDIHKWVNGKSSMEAGKRYFK